MRFANQVFWLVLLASGLSALAIERDSRDATGTSGDTSGRGGFTREEQNHPSHSQLTSRLPAEQIRSDGHEKVERTTDRTGHIAVAPAPRPPGAGRETAASIRAPIEGGRAVTRPSDSRREAPRRDSAVLHDRGGDSGRTTTSGDHGPGEGRSSGPSGRRLEHQASRADENGLHKEDDPQPRWELVGLGVHSHTFGIDETGGTRSHQVREGSVRATAESVQPGIDAARSPHSEAGPRPRWDLIGLGEHSLTFGIDDTGTRSQHEARRPSSVQRTADSFKPDIDTARGSNPDTGLRPRWDFIGLGEHSLTFGIDDTPVHPRETQTSGERPSVRPASTRSTGHADSPARPTYDIINTGTHAAHPVSDRGMDGSLATAAHSETLAARQHDSMDPLIPGKLGVRQDDSKFDPLNPGKLAARQGNADFDPLNPGGHGSRSTSSQEREDGSARVARSSYSGNEFRRLDYVSSDPGLDGVHKRSPDQSERRSPDRHSETLQREHTGPGSGSSHRDSAATPQGNLKPRFDPLFPGIDESDIPSSSNARRATTEEVAQGSHKPRVDITFPGVGEHDISSSLNARRATTEEVAQGSHKPRFDTTFPGVGEGDIPSSSTALRAAHEGVHQESHKPRFDPLFPGIGENDITAPRAAAEGNVEGSHKPRFDPLFPGIDEDVVQPTQRSQASRIVKPAFDPIIAGGQEPRGTLRSKSRRGLSGDVTPSVLPTGRQPQMSRSIVRRALIDGEHRADLEADVAVRKARGTFSDEAQQSRAPASWQGDVVASSLARPYRFATKMLSEDPYVYDQTGSGQIVFSSTKTAPQGIVHRPPLECFEVTRPPRLIPTDTALESTTIELLQRSFANSYDKPSRIAYTPTLLPATFSDPSRWVEIVLTQHGVARGKQFDRLGSIYIGNDQSGQGAEIWRTDNPEPVNTTGGIVWTARKEVNKYYDLFRRPGTLLFDFPNIVNENYTAALNLTLSMTVTQLRATDGEESPPESQAGPPGLQPLAETTPLVYAISKRNATSGSKWAINGEAARAKIRLPSNAAAALVEVFASGTADDEFWYTGTPDLVYNAFPNASKLFTPRGSYRELQVRIDGHLAGITHPYPVIFTGGVHPLLWRPQVGYGALDQPTYLFDVTPFLGYLTDEREHDFSLHVVSAEKNQSIPNSWFVSGNLQVVVKGPADQASASAFPKTLPRIREEGYFHADFTYVGTVKDPREVATVLRTSTPRSLTVEADLALPEGATQRFSVHYTLDYSNDQKLQIKDMITNLTQTVTGTQTSMHGSRTFLSHQYRYPLTLNTAPATPDSDLTVSDLPQVFVKRGYFSRLQLSGLTAAAGSQSSSASQWSEPELQTIDTSQVATADGLSYGHQQQRYDYYDSNGKTYHEDVKVFNRTVISVQKSGNLAPFADSVP
ncbi:unnamed protein product [Parajaminaea phylloscopi]